MRIFASMFDRMFAGRKPSLSGSELAAVQDRHAAAGLHSAAGAPIVGATTIAMPAPSLPAGQGQPPPRRRRQPRRVVEPKSTVEVVPPHVEHCPRNADHKRIRAWRVQRSRAHFLCNDCGHVWDVPSHLVETLAVFAVNLAESLDAAKRIAAPDDVGSDVVVIDDRTAKEIADKLRFLADCQ